jgi:SPP1 family predicted phage head-tail adaptor
MNHRIKLLKRQDGRDAAGQSVESWPELASVWADVRFEKGVEVLRANADASVVRASIRVRTRSDVDHSMRVSYLGTAYDIKAVLPDSSDRRFMFLVCWSVK